MTAPHPWPTTRLCPATSNLPTRMLPGTWRTLCASYQGREAVGANRQNGMTPEDFAAISAARFPCATCGGRTLPPGLELITKQEASEMARQTKRGICELCGAHSNVGMNHIPARHRAARPARRRPGRRPAGQPDRGGTEGGMKTITVEEFHAALMAQGATTPSDFVFICPMCETLQTGSDLIRAGAGETLDDVKKYLGFSCVGRWTGDGPPRKQKDGKPCNWTLGGLFKTHKLEVITNDGKSHPSFEVATPEQAQSHWARRTA